MDSKSCQSCHWSKKWNLFNRTTPFNCTDYFIYIYICMCMCEVRQVFERWYRKIDKILRWKNDGAQWSQKKPKINAILCAKRIHDRFQFTDPFRKKRSAFSIYDNFISCVIYLSFLIISKLLHCNSVHHSTLPCQKLFTKNCRVYIYDIYSPRLDPSIDNRETSARGEKVSLKLSTRPII